MRRRRRRLQACLCILHPKIELYTLKKNDKKFFPKRYGARKIADGPAQTEINDDVAGIENSIFPFSQNASA